MRWLNVLFYPFEMMPNRLLLLALLLSPAALALYPLPIPLSRLRSLLSLSPLSDFASQLRPRVRSHYSLVPLLRFPVSCLLFSLSIRGVSLCVLFSLLDVSLKCPFFPSPP